MRMRSRVSVQGLGRVLRWWMTDERLFWRACAAFFFALAVLKGLHTPREWPLTQAELDYSHGFVKRGLRGAILGLCHIRHWRAMSVVFFLELATLFVLLVVLLYYARVEERFGSLAPVCVFTSSYAVTYLTYSVGYTDIPLAAITVLLLLIANSVSRFWCAVVLIPIALLIHESFLILFLPILLFSFLLEAWMDGEEGTKRKLVMAGLLASLAVAVTLVTSSHANLSAEEAQQFAGEVSARADFDVRDDFFNVLSRPLSGSIREGLYGFVIPEWAALDAATLINLLPIVLTCIYFTRRLLRHTLNEAALIRRISWALAAVIASPLVMYLLGVDGARWNTACALVAFMSLLVLSRRLPPGGLKLTPAERNGIVVLLAFNMATGMGFFGPDKVNQFPFFPQP